MRLPRMVVYAGLLVAFAMGQVLLWNEKRSERPKKMADDSIGSEKLA